jgi:hypothetical protein
MARVLPPRVWADMKNGDPGRSVYQLAYRYVANRDYFTVFTAYASSRQARITH